MLQVQVRGDWLRHLPDTIFIANIERAEEPETAGQMITRVFAETQETDADLTAERYGDVLKIFLDHVDVVTPMDGLPPVRKLEHAPPAVHRILETPGSTPPYRRPYRLNPREFAELAVQLEKLLAKGYIEFGSSPYGSPVLFAPKPGGQLRMCIDYRPLNAQTVPDKYPLPMIDEMFDAVQGARFFMTLERSCG
mmetsp:Transcript_4485/g.20390  ORF Transcript_4485/g.20390 Transcript_4485/m.20390 type:complete len:194 (+) Transcript_4485:1897-2478(+)